MIFVTFLAHRFAPEAELISSALKAFFSTHEWWGPISAEAFVRDEPDMYGIFTGLEDAGAGAPPLMPDVVIVFLPYPDRQPSWMNSMYQLLKKHNPRMSIVWVLWNPGPYDAGNAFTAYQQPEEDMFVMNILPPDSWPKMKHERTPERILLESLYTDAESQLFPAFIQWLAKFMANAFWRSRQDSVWASFF